MLPGYHPYAPMNYDIIHMMLLNCVEHVCFYGTCMKLIEHNSTQHFDGPLFHHFPKLRNIEDNSSTNTKNPAVSGPFFFFGKVHVLHLGLDTFTEPKHLV